MTYDPSADDISVVRFHVGDTSEPYQLTDTEVQFAIDQTANLYAAAAVCARALAARYARRVDTRFETIESKYSQLRDNYATLARDLEAAAKKAGGIGLPLAGGIDAAEVAAVRADTSRVRSFFYDNMFNNPPPTND